MMLSTQSSIPLLFYVESDPSQVDHFGLRIMTISGVDNGGKAYCVSLKMTDQPSVIYLENLPSTDTSSCLLAGTPRRRPCKYSFDIHFRYVINCAYVSRLKLLLYKSLAYQNKIYISMSENELSN